MEEMGAVGIGIDGIGAYYNDMIFDGKEFANKETNRLRDEVIKKTKMLGRKPSLATIYNPEDKASRIYTEIKAEKADEIGIEFEKYSVIGYQLPISQLVEKLNSDEQVDGIMIQTPLIKERESGRVEEQKLCKQISPKKDADGLNPESGVIPATVKAVLKIMSQIQGIRYKTQENKIIVVGQRGLVGRNLIIQLSNNPVFKITGMSANKLNISVLQNADVIISATGKVGLIGPDMIKDGAVCIDVGYPKGDFSPDCAQKASFFTPVPGGVGPVTVICLFENLIEML